MAKGRPERPLVSGEFSAARLGDRAYIAVSDLLLRIRDAFESTSMVGNSWRVFLAGALCGSVLTTSVGLAWFWWKPSRGLSAHNVGGWTHSPENDAEYDVCLAMGKTKAACDAWMRILARVEAANAPAKKMAEDALAAGLTTCEVARRGYEQGFVGSQMSAALGIPQDELIKACPYP